MNNTEEFEFLCWFESSIQNMKYEDNCLSFTMTDLISYTPKPVYEYVEIAIQNIESLNVYLLPFINGRYAKEESLAIGKLNYSNSLGFEGKIKANPFISIKANFFWITADFQAANILIKRTDNKFSLNLDNKLHNY